MARITAESVYRPSFNASKRDATRSFVPAQVPGWFQLTQPIWCHCIPLTTGCKVQNSPDEDDYTDNLLSTNFWNIFTKKGVVLDDYCRDRAVKLIEKTFPEAIQTRQRSVRICFTYNPDQLTTLFGPQESNGCEEAVVIIFDYNNEPFKNLLIRHCKEAIHWMDVFVVWSN